MSHLSRRQVLGAATASALGGAVPRIASADVAKTASDKSVVFICLRGGADGLSIVVPYRDPIYYGARKLTSIKPPGSAPNAALDLDGTFGLHPKLSTLKPLYDAGELALVVGVGSPQRIGSHHEARAHLDDALKSANGNKAPEAMSGTLTQQLDTIANRARAGQLAGAAVVEAPGWDTHALQGDGSQGELAERLAELGTALAEFRRALGADFNKVLVVVVTEFGRSLFETPLEGTDDGYASVLLLLSSHRRWGRVFGQMPSLACNALLDGRHLKPTRGLADALSQVTQGKWP